MPASIMLGLRGTIRATAAASPLTSILTSRETAVAKGLRMGKANKIIAYELNMCESTVKVHVHNIMKKLKATNRTEAAYRISEMAA